MLGGKSEGPRTSEIYFEDENEDEKDSDHIA